MMNAAIAIDGLRKRFGEQHVLNGIDLNVPEGSIFALLGPNGAGKTTLIRILSTLVKPDAGRVRVAGCDLAADPDGVRRAIALTGQFAAVDEALTGEENLRMMARLSGLSAADARRRAAELLERFDLSEAARKRAGTYSGGMRRRLDLAVSLVVRRPVLFLDEPTTGLDPVSRGALWDMILALAAEGVTVLLTTQYLEEADRLADRIAVLVGGRLAAEGTADSLKQRIGDDVIEVRDSRDAIIRTVPTDGSVRHLRQALDALAGVVPEGARIRIRRPSMDDVFVALTAAADDKKEVG